jgi:phage anti-repressor protein
MNRDILTVRRNIMFELELIEKKGMQLVDSKLLHKNLEVASSHADWIRRRIENYGFEEGQDYILYHCSTLRGGTKRNDYYLTIDMAKELCMLENNEKGKATRKYFIAAEKEYRKQYIVLMAGKAVRKSLTDVLKDTGENERMHNQGYPTYTLMIYSLMGIKEQFKEWKKTTGGTGEFRLTLDLPVREKLATIESLVGDLLKLDKQYSEIKEIIEPFFKDKSVDKARLDDKQK